MTMTCFIRYEIDPFKKDLFTAYEAYRQRLNADAEGKANFDWAQRERFILRETRSFTAPVMSTYLHLQTGDTEFS